MIRITSCAALLLVAGPAPAQPFAAQPAPGAAGAVIARSSSVLPPAEPDRAALPTRLIWSDEFAERKLDTAKWPRNGIIRFPGQPADTTLAAGTGETQRYDSSEGTVAAGQLRLSCEPDSGEGHEAWQRAVKARAGTPPYAGQGLARLAGVTDKCGMIHTYPKYVSPPGSLIEMRVTLPTGCKGRWPAAWMFAYPYPGSPNPNAGIPFAGQENDIFEANGRGQLKITLHNDIKPDPQVTASYTSAPFVVRQWRDRSGKRVYEWIDGKLIAVMPAGNTNDLSLPVMLNMAGGTPSWPFIGMPDASTPRVCEMRVDYIRIYGA